MRKHFLISGLALAALLLVGAGCQAPGGRPAAGDTNKPAAAPDVAPGAAPSAVQRVAPDVVPNAVPDVAPDISADSAPETAGQPTSLLTEAEARAIATKACVKGGETLASGYHNDYTKTWWFDANLNSAPKGCNPACVVSDETKQAEINWRCTGLLPPQ